MDVNGAVGLINESVRGLSAYHLTPDAVSVKLNQNENPFDWPQDIKEEVARFCIERPWNRYPDFVPAQLKKQLAQYVGLAPENVLVGNGSNEMLLVLLLSLADSSKPLVTCQPTFTVYRLLSRGMSRDSEPVFLRPDLSFDVGAICDAVARRPQSVLLLCSPNNPTGGALTEQDIRAILSRHSGFLILDQAYVEFGGFSAVGLIKEFPNLIVTRTFSKAFAAAGLRLGYLLGAAEVVAEINKIKLPYNINFFADHVASVLLSHTKLAQERIAAIKKERDRVTSFLRSVPQLTVYPTCANFILVRSADKDALFAFLRTHDVLVRDVSSYPMLDNCLRVSIGSAQENDALMAALGAYRRA